MGKHSDQAAPWPTSNRDLLTATATAVPVWNFYGFAVRFFHDTWGDVAFPVVPVSYGLNAGFVVLLPFLPRGGTTTLRVAAALGGLMAVWSAIGMRYSPRSKLPYTAVPTLLGAATAILANRAAKEPATRA